MPKIPLEAPEGFTLQVGIPISHLWVVEFHNILGQLTVAEESDIRQITPLISIVRLKHGNVGAERSCIMCSTIFQSQHDSTNLPQQCKFLVFQRTHGDGSMKSFTARRPWIQRVLEMYQHISRDVPAWDIQIEKLHLQEWPENGNILDVVKTFNTETVIDSPAGDEDVLGPAPLQNIEDPNEVFIGTRLPNGEDNLKQRIGDATLALEDFANNIEVVGDKAKMQQKDVLPIGTFARMEDTPYAWALAFPTLFPPTFRKNKWVILEKKNPTWVPVPPTVFRCKRDCCRVTTMALRIHKVTSVHKGQGISCGKGPFFSFSLITSLRLDFPM